MTRHLNFFYISIFYESTMGIYIYIVKKTQTMCTPGYYQLSMPNGNSCTCSHDVDIAQDITKHHVPQCMSYDEAIGKLVIAGMTQ